MNNSNAVFRVRAALKQFRWITSYYPDILDRTHDINVQRIDLELLCATVDAWNIVGFHDKEGNLLFRKGGEGYAPFSWKNIFKDFSGSGCDCRHGTIRQIMEKEVTQRDREATEYLIYFDHRNGFYCTLTVYKLPKGYRINEWLAKCQEDAEEQIANEFTSAENAS